MTRVEQARAIQRPGETLISALHRLDLTSNVIVHDRSELRDPLGPAAAILVCAALSIPFWALVGYLAWRAFR